MDLGSIVLWIIVGGIAGLLADWVIKGVRLGLLGAIVVGILGGFLGGWLFGLSALLLLQTCLNRARHMLREGDHDHV